MRKSLTHFWKGLVRLEEVRAVILWLLPSAGSGLTMVSAYLDGLPWHQILFWGSGVFAFFMVGISYAFDRRDKLTTFEKLRLSQVSISQLFKTETGDEIGIATQYTFHNHADVQMYVSFVRAAISIDGRVNPKAGVDSAISLVQPHSDHVITGATVPNIAKKPSLQGNVEFEIHYGAKRESLSYRMNYEGEMAIYITDDPNNPHGAHITISARHKKVDHSMREAA